MEHLPDIGVPPDFGLKEGGQFAVQSVSFGDGYTQRRPDGINTVRRKWSLNWSLLERTQKDTLVNFALSKKGVYAFYWTIPDSDETVRVVCAKYPSWVADDYGIYSVSMELTEDLGFE